MSKEAIELFSVFGAGVLLTLIVGFACILTTTNLIRTLIGVEVLTKAVTLLIIVTGYAVGQTALAQALAITLIVIEVVVIVVAVGVVLSIHRHNDSVESTLLRNLKG